MSLDSKKKDTEGRAIEFAKWIVDAGVAGPANLASSKRLALEYALDDSYPGDDARVDSLVNWETAKNFTSGFITGLGGAITLPISIPAALGASWLIQARMVGAIAEIYGHTLSSDRVRTMILLVVLGDAAIDVLKEAGVRTGVKLTEKVIAKVPGKVLIEINKRVGFRLLTKAGERGIINLTKVLPVVGGIISGAFDATTCRACGQLAKETFRRTPKKKKRSKKEP